MTRSARTGHSRLRFHHFLRHEQEQAPVLFIGPAEQTGGISPASGHPCRNRPRQWRRPASALEEREVWAARRRRKKAGKEELRGRGRIFPAFPRPARYARFRRARYSSGAGPSAFQFHLGRISSVPARTRNRSPIIMVVAPPGLDIRIVIARRLTNNQDRAAEAYIRR